MIVQLYDGSLAHWPSGEPVRQTHLVLRSTDLDIEVWRDPEGRNDFHLFFEEFEAIAEMGCRADVYHSVPVDES